MPILRRTLVRPNKPDKSNRSDEPDLRDFFKGADEGAAKVVDRPKCIVGNGIDTKVLDQQKGPGSYLYRKSSIFLDKQPVSRHTITSEKLFVYIISPFGAHEGTEPVFKELFRHAN